MSPDLAAVRAGAHADDVVRIEAEFQRTKRPDRAHEQAGRDDQQERERHLGHRQALPETPAVAPRIQSARADGGVEAATVQ